MASQDFTKLLEGMKEIDLKLFAACYLYANIKNSEIDLVSVAKELDCRSKDPKKAIDSIRERIRMAKSRLPRGLPTFAPSGGIGKNVPGKTSPSKRRKAAGTKPAAEALPAKKGRKVKKELAEDDGAAVKEED